MSPIRRDPVGVGGDNPEAAKPSEGPKLSLAVRQLAGAFGKPSAVVQRDLDSVDDVVGVLANGDIAICANWRMATRFRRFTFENVISGKKWH